MLDSVEMELIKLKNSRSYEALKGVGDGVFIYTTPKKTVMWAAS